MDDLAQFREKLKGVVETAALNFTDQDIPGPRIPGPPG